MAQRQLVLSRDQLIDLSRIAKWVRRPDGGVSLFLDAPREVVKIDPEKFGDFLAAMEAAYEDPDDARHWQKFAI